MSGTSFSFQNCQYCILTLRGVRHSDVPSKQLKHWLSPRSLKLPSKDLMTTSPFQSQSYCKSNPSHLTSQSSPCGHQLTVLLSPLFIETVCLLSPPQPRRQCLERNSIPQDIGKRLTRPCPVRICPGSSNIKTTNHTYRRVIRWKGSSPQPPAWLYHKREALLWREHTTTNSHGVWYCIPITWLPQSKGEVQPGMEGEGVGGIGLPEGLPVPMSLETIAGPPISTVRSSPATIFCFARFWKMWDFSEGRRNP